MTGAGLILHPPRAYQIVILVQIPESPLTDDQLPVYLQQQVNVSLAIAPHVKTIATVRVANLPTGVATE